MVLEDVPNTPSQAVPTFAGRLAWLAVVAGLPVLGLACVVLAWRPPTVQELIVAACTYTIAGLGISLGWHRFFTHRSFECGPRLARLLAIAGSLAFEGSLASWVAGHRAHHAHTDRPGDPHSPWTSETKVRGFLHAHLGWLRRPGVPAERLARDVLRDPVLVRISNRWWAYALAGIMFPALVAGIVGGWRAFFGMAAWAGVLRVVCFHHVTWSVNSVCHMFGSRLYETKDRSGNVAWLALATFGESWHNNHHHVPRAARHGMRRGQLDVTAELLRLLERVGLAWSCQWPERPAR